MSLELAQTIVFGHVSRVRGRLRATQILTGLFALGAIVVGGGTFFALLEGFFHFGAWPRFFMAVTLCVAAMGGLALLVFRPLFIALTDEAVALFIERAFPDIQNALINGVRLLKSRPPEKTPFWEMALREIAETLQDKDFAGAVRLRGLLKSALAFLFCALLAGSYAALAPARFANALDRILHPFADIPVVGSIIIASVEPGDATVVSGDPLPVKAVIRNAPKNPAKAYFESKPTKGKIERKRMFPTSADTYVFTVPEVTQPFVYRVHIGESQSKWFAVKVTEKPCVTNISVRYDFPDYTGLDDKTVDASDGNLEALVGTVAYLTISTNKPIASACVEIDGKQKRELITSSDRRTLTGSVPMDRDGIYTIHLKDPSGYTNDPPVVHTIRVRKDAAPEVKVEKPGKDVAVAPGGSVHISIRAQDDYGLKSVAIMGGKAEEEPTVIQKWDNLKQKDAMLSYDWLFKKNEAKIGEEWVYFVRAVDNSVEPNSADSAHYKIRVEDPEAVKKQKEERYEKWRREIEKILKAQEEARKTTDELLKGGVSDGQD